MSAHCTSLYYLFVISTIIDVISSKAVYKSYTWISRYRFSIGHTPSTRRTVPACFSYPINKPHVRSNSVVLITSGWCTHLLYIMILQTRSDASSQSPRSVLACYRINIFWGAWLLLIGVHNGSHQLMDRARILSSSQLIMFYVRRAAYLDQSAGMDVILIVSDAAIKTSAQGHFIHTVVVPVSTWIHLMTRMTSVSHLEQPKLLIW